MSVVNCSPHVPRWQRQLWNICRQSLWQQNVRISLEQEIKKKDLDKLFLSENRKEKKKCDGKVFFSPTDGEKTCETLNYQGWTVGAERTIDDNDTCLVRRPRSSKPVAPKTFNQHYCWMRPSLRQRTTKKTWPVKKTHSGSNSQSISNTVVDASDWIFKDFF